ncbi:LytR family transcriptional regulator [Secundilactobacillus silagincola]|uniref:LytR family transcriptional regulator n=1 Tax=Secundilactobacillus silagincola TaxID=1714681 RepID=A0A1Z5J340_9LACO|nr:LCP family protein [Secundilactobacillus silagincola]GAX08510.1 LytR family transcriptional regulator [Secundilactobacillus silagincola]
MPNQEPKHLTPKKRSKKRRVFTWILFALIIMIGAGGTYVAYQTKASLDKTYSAAHGASKTKVSNSKPVSILLMGTDTGALGRTDKGRTDTIMVVTINPKTKKATMVSIPRDTLVKISGTNDTEKINAAYTVGGASTSMKTVENLLNVPINYYVLINMGGLEKVVNAIGGIDVKVPFSWNDSHTHMSFKKGNAHLNGKQALAFARMRYEDPNGDYGRQQRQQQVIQQIVKKVTKSGNVSMYQKLLSLLSSNMKTNMAFNDMISLAENDKGSVKHVKKSSLKGVGAYINAESFQIPASDTLQSTSDSLRSSLGLSKETLDNFNTQENQQNTKNGFDWKSGNNPTYTVYDSNSTNQ